MKLLLDANVSRVISSWLESLGHDVLHAKTLPKRTTDNEILRIATAQNRIVVTSDKDFGELVFRINESAAGVILLRVDVATEAERLAVLQRFWPSIEGSAADHFLVVSTNNVRRTALPQ